MKWQNPKYINNEWVIEGTSYEEAGAEIYLLECGSVNLYEITQYGSATMFDGNYPDVESAMKVAESWT